jgi:hypothetical protein
MGGPRATARNLALAARAIDDESTMKIAKVGWAVTFVVAGSVACGGNFLGDGDGGTGGSGGGDDAGSSASPDAATGAGCTGNLGGNVSLCTYISVCPSIGVDHDQFPNCGFHIRGDVIDLECVCNGTSLCPMGAPTSCTQAAQLLKSQTELIVCQQVADDRCTSLVSASADAGTNPCNTECAGQCGGDPSCIQGCGC